MQFKKYGKTPEEIKNGSDAKDNEPEEPVVKTRKRKKRAELPMEILAFPNTDKDFHEQWHPERDLLSFPHPFRAVLLGPPNSGKSTIVKNLLLRGDPDFAKMYVIHADADGTSEYDDCKAVLLPEIPEPQDWPNDKEKKLVVVDDIDVKRLGKQQMSALDRLFGYVSTHKNISCILCSQDVFNIPAGVRRCANLWVLWKSPDTHAVSMCASRCGKLDFDNLFNKNCLNPHDSVWVDMTDNTPLKLRTNGYREALQ